MEHLYLAGGLAVAILYSPTLFKCLINWDYSVLTTGSSFWLRISLLSVSLGMLISSATVVCYKSLGSSAEQLMLLGQAFAILGGVASQTWLQGVKNSYKASFWFAAAVPVLVLLYAGAR